MKIQIILICIYTITARAKFVDDFIAGLLKTSTENLTCDPLEANNCKIRQLGKCVTHQNCQKVSDAVKKSKEEYDLFQESPECINLIVFHFAEVKLYTDIRQCNENEKTSMCTSEKTATMCTHCSIEKFNNLINRQIEAANQCVNKQ